MHTRYNSGIDKSTPEKKSAIIQRTVQTTIESMIHQPRLGIQMTKEVSELVKQVKMKKEGAVAKLQAHLRGAMDPEPAKVLQSINGVGVQGAPAPDVPNTTHSTAIDVDQDSSEAQDSKRKRVHGEKSKKQSGKKKSKKSRSSKKKHRSKHSSESSSESDRKSESESESESDSSDEDTPRKKMRKSKHFRESSAFRLQKEALGIVLADKHLMKQRAEAEWHNTKTPKEQFLTNFAVSINPRFQELCAKNYFLRPMYGSTAKECFWRMSEGCKRKFVRECGLEYTRQILENAVAAQHFFGPENKFTNVVRVATRVHGHAPTDSDISFYSDRPWSVAVGKQQGLISDTDMSGPEGRQ